MTKQHLKPEERLADALDKQIPPHSIRTTSEAANPLVNTAARLAKTPPPALSPDAFDRIHAKVMAAQANMPTAEPQAEPQPAPKSEPIQLQSARPRLLTFKPLMSLASVAAALVLMIWVPLAAASALPGETLYPVKRGMEFVQLRVAESLDRETDVYLFLAERRAEEAILLMNKGEAPHATLEESVDYLVQAAQSVPPGTNIQSEIDQIQLLIDDTLAGLQPPNNPPQLVAIVPSETPTTTPTHTPEAEATDEPLQLPPAPQGINLQVEDTPLPAFIYAYGVVNVRSAPYGEVIARLSPNTAVRIVAWNGDKSWGMIYFGDGQFGWVADFLLYEGDVAPPTPMPPPPTQETFANGQQQQTQSGGTITLDDGTVVNRDEVIVNPNGSVTSPNGETLGTTNDPTTGNPADNGNNDTPADNGNDNNNNPPAQDDCPGNSCNSQGVPGGFTPPGQSDNSPPPGQSNDDGPGNSGNNNGRGNNK